MSTLVNITDIIEPQVRYKGSVKVLYIDKSSGKTRIIKKNNSGGPGLFTAICRMLIGLDSTEFIPAYIMGYNAGGSQLFTQNITFASTPVLYKTEDDGKKDAIAESAASADIVQYTFMIPANNLVSRTQKISQIKLFNNRDEVCAILELDDDAIETAIGSNILIYWKLKFA